MKKLLIGAAAAAVIFATGCKNKHEDLLSVVKERGSLTIAMEGSWAPWTYHDDKEMLVGFDKEIGEKIAEKLNVKANFVEVDWDGIFAGIDSGIYDIACNGVTFTEDRAAKYDFSIPYAYTKTVVIVKEDNNSIKSFDDFKGKTTTNSLGSTYADVAEGYGAKVITIDSFDETLELVRFGRADATLNDNASYYYYKTVQPASPFKIAFTASDTDKVCIPMRKGKETENFRAAVNKAIEELQAEGEIARISKKYFGDDISK